MHSSQLLEYKAHPCVQADNADTHNTQQSVSVCKDLCEFSITVFAANSTEDLSTEIAGNFWAPFSF